MATKQSKNRVDVPAFKWGKVDHPSGGFTVDRGWFDDYREGFEKLSEHGYFAPLLMQHKSDGKGKETRRLEEGFIYGKTVDVYADDEGVWHTMEVPDEVKDLIDKGFIDEWSPSWREGWAHPHTGEELKLAPRHMSFVSVPHQKNLPSISNFYDLAEGEEITQGLIYRENNMPKDNENKTGQSTDNAPKEAAEVDLTPLLDEINALGGMIQELIQLQGEDADSGGDDEDVTSAEEEALKKELAETKSENRKLKNAQIRQNIKALGVDDDETVEGLVELAEADSVSYATKLAGTISELSESRTTRQPEKGSGASGNVSQVDETLSPSEAMELAEEHLEGEESYKSADPAKRGRMKVAKARELRGEA